MPPVAPVTRAVRPFTLRLIASTSYPCRPTMRSSTRTGQEPQVKYGQSGSLCPGSAAGRTTKTPRTPDRRGCGALRCTGTVMRRQRPSP
jgi:hypothetical protein